MESTGGGTGWGRWWFLGENAGCGVDEVECSQQRFTQRSVLLEFAKEEVVDGAGKVGGEP
jgi:hypothetical protein